MHLGHGQFVNRLRTRPSSKNYVTHSPYGEASDISLTAGFDCSRKNWIADSQYNLSDNPVRLLVFHAIQTACKVG